MGLWGCRTDKSSDIFLYLYFTEGSLIASKEGVEGIHTSIPMGTYSICDFLGGVWKRHPLSGSAHGQFEGGDQTDKISDDFLLYF